MIKTVEKFPEVFKASANANIVEAMDWWKKRDTILPDDEEDRVQLSISRVSNAQRRKVFLKALPGRGRRKAPWVEWIYEQLVEEFDRLRKAGVAFDTNLLISLAKDIIEKSDHAVFKRGYKETEGSISIEQRITTCWMQLFMEHHNVVCRKQCGKLDVSPEKRLYIDKTVAFHLGTSGYNGRQNLLPATNCDYLVAVRPELESLHSQICASCFSSDIMEIPARELISLKFAF
ncbi:hypothetical protein RCL1_008918 [Eukaryota sp. TZLM3-RCL]